MKLLEESFKLLGSCRPCILNTYFEMLHNVSMKSDPHILCSSAENRTSSWI